MIELIMKDTPVNCQIILCGMEKPHLEIFKKDANVISLDESKLLHTELYENLSEELTKFLNID